MWTPSDWTPERDERLRQLWRSGYTVNQIAEDLRKTRNAIVGRVNRMGGIVRRASPIILTGKSGKPRPSRAKAKVETKLEKLAPDYDNNGRAHGKNDGHVVFDNAHRQSNTLLLTEPWQLTYSRPEHEEPQAPVSNFPGVAWANSDGCQWHLRREGVTHIFCGKSVHATKGGSWCAHHRSIVFQPKSAPNANS